jgi:hypothetical protein
MLVAMIALDPGYVLPYWQYYTMAQPTLYCSNGTANLTCVPNPGVQPAIFYPPRPSCSFYGLPPYKDPVFGLFAIPGGLVNATADVMQTKEVAFMLVLTDLGNPQFRPFPFNISDCTLSFGDNFIDVTGQPLYPDTPVSFQPSTVPCSYDGTHFIYVSISL